MFITSKQIDNTIYIVENIISDKAKETPYDKAKRMLLNDTKFATQKKVS